MQPFSKAHALNPFFEKGAYFKIVILAVNLHDLLTRIVLLK